MVENVSGAHAPDRGRLKARSMILLVLLLPMLLYLLTQSIFSGMTYLNRYQLNITMNQWYKKQSPVTPVEWQAMEARALNLLRRNSNSAAVMNAVGRLYDYRSTHIESSRREKHAYGNTALGYYRAATRLRPAGLAGWKNFAVAKARQGRVDAEFRHALLQLLHLGPWEKYTLPIIIKLGLFSWAYLDKSERQVFLKYFAVAQESRKQDVQNVLNKTGRMTLYCALLTHYGKKASFCP